ncbi:Endochitinase 1 OS=Coccidioides immitis (strain RS) GN=CTS1 PE=3 SV=1 [Rhizoctonia solani AG-1 IB]|uniref:chitinase n=1 Tax=Thanatephorus cucumeris (strain AG1-IB / isolate 7/3/14) TaxID=1108050 RepID=A0A0B7F3H7_THACB|nr:Endochitinase 1 OS=Coccidioides immitis (strain RS) GN=CTS1 PE=3 SV=1 [Rhizoctonia solani AG-1 IB]
MQLVLLLSALSLYAGTASATQVMHRPEDFQRKYTPNTSIKLDLSLDLNLGNGCSFEKGGKVNIAYFTNWGIYGRKFTPLDVNIDSLTHIYYAFADTDPLTGQASLTDLWADQQITYAGDDNTVAGNNLYGNLKQLYLLKQKKRSLKTILSFGGWTYSQAGHFNFATNATSRANFVKTAIQLLEDNGFDGLDIDWEYPAAGEQSEAFVALLKETRAGLDAHAKSKGDTVPYQLNAAVPAGSQNYQNLKVKDMDKYLNYWTLMAYDYSGSWSTVTDYLANVYGGAFSGVSTSASTEWYLKNGASKSKFAIGMPIYGRGFQNTNGIFQSFNGTGPGTWEAGVYDYKALPFANATVYTDSKNISSYSYDPIKKELISYDTPAVTAAKAKWLSGQGLAGAMFWELSADKNGTDSLVWTAAKTMAKLDNTPNHLNYPGSQFENVKAGMKTVSKRGHKVKAKYF